ncbi:MAG TPA: thiamine pyrophosphate-binding protein [Candidatus Dormibacteraeota bacterium]|nr:thiamine pyrophosphate-binding protein [Candidatus Dormibacteraeota bacterium]
MGRRFSGTGAEILIESLLEAGLDTIFGVPGDTGVALYDALHHRPRLRHVLTNDERGAAFAADAFARRRNALAAIEVSSGGGVTFAVGGLGEAYAASVPLLVLTSDVHRRSRGTGALTEIDQVALFQAVTKWQATASDAAELPALVEEAVGRALADRPAPVALIVPEDVLDERGRVELRPIAISLPPGRPLPASEALDRFAAALDGARRPAIVAGGGVHLSGAHAALATLAERAGAAVAVTVHGKGAIDERHPLSLGTLGANGGCDRANRYLARADVVLLVGTRANATDTDGFASPPRRGTTVGQIDIEPGRAGRNYPGSVPLPGDALATLSALAERIRPHPRRAAATAEEIQGEPVSTAPPAGRGRPGTLDPAEVVAALRTVAGDTITVVGDCGTPTPYLAAGWRLEEPGRRLILPRGHGPMGYAYPGAVGAALACAGDPVLAVTTDGSLLMAAGALETVARMGLPIVYVQLSNASLGWIKALQHLYYGGRYFGTQLSSFDTVGVARAFGLHARRIEDVDELAAAVGAALRARRPALFEVPVPDEHELIPPVAPWRRAAAAPGSGRPVY